MMMTNRRSGREALHGVEAQTLDLIFKVLTSDKWSELLKLPLEMAAGQGNRVLAQKLVEAGARIGNALHKAVRGDNTEIVNDLLEQGASINAIDTNNGEIPLHFAAGSGNTEMVEVLMRKGADTDALDAREQTALYWATTFGQVCAAEALLAGDADVNLRCGLRKRSVIHIAAKEGVVDILRAAIEHGADVDAADTLQKTALHLAAEYNEAEAIDVLVEAGANTEAQAECGATPLHFAAGNLNLDASTALLKHGANANAPDYYLHTPLYSTVGRAGSRGAAEVVGLLLRSGADDTNIDGSGESAADVVATVVKAETSFPEDVERVLELLADAPADRAWRRRGYLVLCRALPDRVQQAQQISIAHSDMEPGICSKGRTDTSACSGIVRESTGVLSKVLELQEEGIFRRIVGYL